MLKGLFGKARAIPADVWAQHQAFWWEHRESPEAQARETRRIQEIYDRFAEEDEPSQ